MEAHKDCIKYNITEGSHKITLTLTWSFRKHKESLWDKLQRTLKLTSEDGNGLPEEVTKFLESPQHHNSSPLRQQNSWNKASSTSLPAKIKQQSSYNTFSPPTQRGMSSRYSWPGASSPLSIRAPLKHSTPGSPEGYDTSDPNLIRSDSTASHCSRIRVTYRSEEEIVDSLEDLLEKTTQHNKEQLESIREEWNRALRNWPSVMDAEGVLNTSSDLTDSDNDARVTTETVAKCLDSCDNILLGSSPVIT